MSPSMRETEKEDKPALDPGDGGTSVQFSVTGRPSGLLRLLQPLIARTTQGNLDRGFARLKALLETGAASGTT